MPDSYISGLTAIVTPVSTDAFAAQQAADATQVKKITLAQIRDALEDGGAAELQDIDAGKLTAGTLPAARLGADSIDAITEIASALKSGADGTLLTGTAGSGGDSASFNGDGDVVASEYFKGSDWLFAAYDATGGTTLANAGTELPWDTEAVKHSNYTHSADGADVTVGATGLYEVEVQVHWTTTAGGDPTMTFWLRDGSDVKYAGTDFAMNSRLNATQGATLTGVVLSLTASDVVTVYYSGGHATTPTTVAGMCRFKIKRVG